MKPIVAAVAVLVAISSSVLARAQTPAEVAEVRAMAEQGVAEYQRVLALMYATGDRVPQSQVEAVRWYRRAADQGDALAQNNMGIRYADGNLGVPQNHTEAVRWWRLASDQGEYFAQVRLGAAYAGGLGVPQNMAEAHKFLTLAIARAPGEERELVVGFRDEFTSLMTPAQIAEAQRLAREWETAHRR